MLAASLHYFSALCPSHVPTYLHTKEGRLHKHLLKWNGVGSPYAYSLQSVVVPLGLVLSYVDFIDRKNCFYHRCK